MTVPARTQSATITSSQIAEFNRDGAILLSQRARRSLGTSAGGGPGICQRPSRRHVCWCLHAIEN